MRATTAPTLPLPLIVGLAAAALLLISLLLPYFMLEDGTALSGLSLLGGLPAAAPLGPLESGLPPLAGWSFLLPLAGLLALGWGGYALVNRRFAHAASVWMLLAGGLALFYFFLVLFHQACTTGNLLLNAAGGGLWLGLIGAVGLVGQRAIPRPAPASREARAVPLLGWLGGRLGGDPVAALAPVIAVLLAFVVGAFLFVALGANPVQAYCSVIDGSLGTEANIFRTITRATPLLLVAIGIAIAFRGGVINIGAEGQLFVGAVAATAFSLAFAPTLAAPLLVIGTLAAGGLAGALWGAVPGVLKAYFKVNEVLSTVMMNEISVQLLIFLLSGPMIDPEQVALGTRVPQSSQLPEAVWMARLAPPSQIHAGIFIGVAAAVIAYVVMWRTTLGYRIRAVGQNRDAARYAGITVPLYMTLAMVFSGMLAGLAGAVEVTGVTHRMVEGFAVGYGFSGIVVALFGRLHPIGAIPASFLFGALLVGADKMQRTIQVHSSTAIALQGLVVLFVVSSDLWVRRRSARRQAQAVRAADEGESGPLAARGAAVG